MKSKLLLSGLLICAAFNIGYAQINSLPQPDPYTAAPTPVCAVYTDSGYTYTVPPVSGAVAYYWTYIGSGVTLYGRTTEPSNTLYFYPWSSPSGILRVWAVNDIFDIIDSSILSRDVAITVHYLPYDPPGSFTAYAATVCQGQSDVIYTVPNASGVTYNWSYTGMGATINGSGNSVTVDFSTSATSGHLLVTATTTNDGCGTNTSSPRSMFVTVNALPNVAITPATTGVCAGESITLTGTGATTYSWSHSGGNSAAATFTPADTTTYTVTGTTSGCSATATRQVTVNPLPVTQITVTGGVTEVCAGDSVVLTASGSGYNYAWKNNSGSIVGNGQQYAARSTGSYKVVATDAGSGCADSTQPVDVYVYNRPVVSLGQADTSFCIGGVIRLEVNTADTGLTYVWKHDGVVRPLDTTYFLEVEESGGYKVIVGRSAISACEDSTNEVAVTVHDLPVVDITWDGEVLHATPGYVSYQWNTGTHDLPGATDSTYTPSVNGGYSVTVTDSNGCGNTSAIETLKNVSVGVLVSAVDIKIYPNPVTGGRVYIESDMDLVIVLSSIDGKILMHGNNLRSIDMDMYAGGMYLLRLLDKDGLPVRTERIVKHDAR